ncbi:MAG TPA: trypsin-like peptidase domain-containing protein [Chloroflexia bacterium]|nr:trypsin-like peptidase domain-containing protein [Chloroflexia bacterium]
MIADRFSSDAEETPSEPAPGNDPLPRSQQWRGRLRQLWARGQRVVLFASGVVAALLAIVIYQALTPPPKQLTTRDVSESIARAFASTTPLPAFSERVYRVVQPSLVLIQAQGTDENGKLEHSVGSGVIINEQGDILTSLHVVAKSNDIQVTFADGAESSAQVTVEQPENDIAVLSASTPPEQIVPATLGNPNAMRVGDEAFAVGNPFGLYGSMSSGVISGFDRSFQPQNSSYRLEGLIQIDAAVNPGNSGGPLLNRYGEVIGIVTGLVNPTEQNFFVGVGFAVPINIAAPAAGAPNY